jgi:hypothetical protein
MTTVPNSLDDDQSPLQEPTLATGTRVRLLHEPVEMTLRGATGRIVRPDRWQGFYIVELDTPAIYRCADGGTEELSEIREGIENLEVVPE